MPNYSTVTIGLARVVNETGSVAPNRSISRPPAIDTETPNMPFFQVLPLAFLALLNQNLLACIVDNPFILVDRFKGENAPSMNLRALLSHPWCLIRHDL